MARKYEFKPDKTDSGILNKLYLTKTQRQVFLKWALYALLVLVLSVVQDVVLCRLRIMGATTDLVPFAIFLVCLTEGSQRGCVFVLLASAAYMFSNPGEEYFAMPLITVTALVVTMFRESYLQKSLGTQLLCLAVCMAIYEGLSFAAGLLWGLTYPGRWVGFAVTAALTMAAVPVVYPAAAAIGKIGGETWKE